MHYVKTLIYGVSNVDFLNVLFVSVIFSVVFLTYILH